MRSFKPDVRRTRVEPVDSVGAAGFRVVVVVVEGGFGAGFLSSTNRPRCLFCVGAGGIFGRDVSFGGGSAFGGSAGGGGGGDGSCSGMTASFERNRNGERCRRVLRIPFDGRLPSLSDFLVVRCFVSRSISSSLKCTLAD